jgi:hypothetical protein
MEAETAAKVVLADVEHRDWEEGAGHAVSPAVWDGLAAHLCFLSDAAVADAAADRGGPAPG